MTGHTYWPYDEVSLDANLSDGQIKLKTPWLEATTSSKVIDAEKFALLSTKLGDNSLSVDDIVLVSSFFRHFRQYPVAYILPTHKTDLLLDTPKLIDQSLLFGSVESVLEKIFAPGSNCSSEFEHHHLSKLFAIFSRKSWEWDAEAAINFAAIDGGVHPESIFSVSRRFHLLEILYNDKGTEIFNNIASLDDQKKFKSAVCCLVRQNHYVTEKCQEALFPALALAGRASLLLELFIKEERGHDKILKRALQHLGEEPQNIEVTVQTKALMHLLKYISKRNFLAFSMAIDSFERNSFESVDPIAKLLLKGGYIKSAELINLHMKINDHGEHDNIAERFLGYMNLCSYEYALEALRLMETLSLVMTSISKSAVQP